MFKSLLKHSIVYGIASALQNAAGFFLLPIYTAYLTVSELGVLEIFIVSINVLFTLLQLGLGSALFKYYSYSDNSGDAKKKNKQIISSSFYFLIAFSLAAIFSFYQVRQYISKLLFNSDSFSNLIILMLITVFFQLFWVIPTAYLRIQNKSVLYSILNGAQFIFQIGIIIFFMVVLHKKIDGVLLGRGLTAFLFAILFIGVVKKQLDFRFSFPVIKELLSYSLFLVPVSIGIMVLMLSNRYFILLFRDSEQLGIFSVANKIASLVLIAVMSFQLAWPSIMFRIREYQNAENYYSRIFSYFIIVFFTFALALTFFSRELTLVLATKDYIAGVFLIPILSLSYLFYGLFYVGTVGINIFKKTYYQTIAMIVGAAANLVLNYILTNAYGIRGTACALCISFALVGLLSFYFSQKVYYIPIEWKRIGKFLLLLSIALAIYQLGLQSNSLIIIVIKVLILVILFPVSLYLFGIFTPDEKKYFWENLLILRQRVGK